jgi:REP element-mobilizing transposase RayT
MPCVKIPIITGESYHSYNRGVDKREIFLDKYDYIRFYQSLHLFNSVEPVTNFRLAKIADPSKKNKKLVEIKAYSLLPNHYHLILKQVHDGGIGEFLRRVGGGYTSYFNEKYNRSGSLFQGTFKRVHISSEEQMQYVFAYVNENHSVHGLTIERELYHSSSLHYQGKRKSQVIRYESKGCYPLLENIKLAEYIYTRRQSMKDLLE